jgi:uncharacterized protein (TIRG00374 family)
VWVGVGITVFFLWLALRDVSFQEVARAIGRARWGVLLGLSIPPYLLAVYFRALRWRHLTDPVQPIGLAPLFRAVAVGFMANNLFPLRMGEVVRAWYLARETGASTAALFGTVILERVLDTVAVIGLALAGLAVLGAEQGGLMARGAMLLLPVAAAPVLVLTVLRLAPERTLALAARLLRPFPARVGTFVEQHLRHFSEGLGALSGGTHLFWIAFHSAVIWLLCTPLPFLAGFLALDIDFGSAHQMVMASWLTVAAIGVAVALPSAPGFFGPYQVACRIALAPFGVDEATAVALGILFNTIFWATLTALGLAVLRWRRTTLGEIEGAVDPPPGDGPA